MNANQPPTPTQTRRPAAPDSSSRAALADLWAAINSEDKAATERVTRLVRLRQNGRLYL